MEENLKLATRIAARILFIIAGLWLAYILRYFLAAGFTCWVIVTALDPFVSRLEKWGLPRGISAVTILILTILAVVWAFSVVVPPLFTQMQILLENLPEFSEKAINTLYFWSRENLDSRLHAFLEPLADNFSSGLAKFPANIFRFGQELTAGFFGLITYIIVTLYLLIEYPRISQSIIKLFSAKTRSIIEQKLTVIDLRIGSWVRGQVSLMLIIGLSTWISLELLQVPFALPLGIAAGVLEVVPMIGPLIAAVPAVIVALAVSPIKALSVGILYLLIQQVENSFVVPKVMARASGIDPLVILVALTLGGRLLGLTGVLIAIPVTIVAWTVIEDKFEVSNSKS